MRNVRSFAMLTAMLCVTAMVSGCHSNQDFYDAYSVLGYGHVAMPNTLEDF
jgi:hypothetical protein